MGQQQQKRYARYKKKNKGFYNKLGPQEDNPDTSLPLPSNAPQINIPPPNLQKLKDPQEKGQNQVHTKSPIIDKLLVDEDDDEENSNTSSVPETSNKNQHREDKNDPPPQFFEQPLEAKLIDTPISLKQINKFYLREKKRGAKYVDINRKLKILSFYQELQQNEFFNNTVHKYLLETAWIFKNAGYDALHELLLVTPETINFPCNAEAKWKNSINLALKAYQNQNDKITNAIGAITTGTKALFKDGMHFTHEVNGAKLAELTLLIRDTNSEFKRDYDFSAICKYDKNTVPELQELTTFSELLYWTNMVETDSAFEKQLPKACKALGIPVKVQHIYYAFCEICAKLRTISPWKTRKPASVAWVTQTILEATERSRDIPKHFNLQNHDRLAYRNAQGFTKNNYNNNYNYNNNRNTPYPYNKGQKGKDKNGDKQGGKNKGKRDFKGKGKNNKFFTNNYNNWNDNFANTSNWNSNNWNTANNWGTSTDWNTTNPSSYGNNPTDYNYAQELQTALIHPKWKNRKRTTTQQCWFPGSCRNPNCSLQHFKKFTHTGKKTRTWYTWDDEETYNEHLKQGTTFSDKQN